MEREELRDEVSINNLVRDIEPIPPYKLCHENKYV